MEKLKEESLYGGELVAIKGALVERYNQCLNIIGKTPTKLSAFSIDGIGWSPEVAEEKDDLYYLNNGEANPHAIIITPQQCGPFRSSGRFYPRPRTFCGRTEAIHFNTCRK